MEKLGFDVEHIVAFDYTKFSEHGSKYLKQAFTKEVASHQEKNSDISLAQGEARKYITTDIHNKRPATWKDIQNYISKGYLVVCNVNADKLSGKSGYTGYFIVYKISDTQIHFHNPGLPPKPKSVLSKKDFIPAWGHLSKQYCELQALKLHI